MSVQLTQNFLGNSRGITFTDGGGATWSFNPNTNSLSLAVSGTGITPGSVSNSDLANMNANTIKGNNTGSAAAPSDLTATQVKTLLSLNLVENTALSTWAGSTNIASVGTIATGVWQGTAIANSFIASALSGKTYNGLTLTTQAIGFTIAGGTTPETLTVGGNATVSGTNTGDQTIPVAAVPTGLIGMSAITGVSAAFDRADSTHAIDPNIAPTWVGIHTFSAAPILNAGITLANTQALQVKSSTGAVSTMLYMFSDNNIYMDNDAGGGINLRVASGTINAVAIANSGTVGFSHAIGVNGASAPAQSTGYGTPTGGAKQASFAAGAITLPNLAAAVAQLIVDLKAIGLIAT